MLPSLANLGCDTEAPKRVGAGESGSCKVQRGARRERRTPILVDGEWVHHYRHAPLDDVSIRRAVGQLWDPRQVAAVTAEYGPVAEWDTSAVTNFFALFEFRTDLTADLSGWDVGNATNMGFMFCGATSFTSDLSKWDVGNVETMVYMFYNARNFTSDLSKWNVSRVERMLYMFFNATRFTSDLLRWDVRNVTDMRDMFSGATSFMSDLSQWDVGNVKYMADMFCDATSFASDLSKWNVGKLTEVSGMFRRAASFGPPLVRSGAGEEGAIWTEESVRAHLDFVRNDETLQTYKSVRVRRRWRRLLWLFKEKKRFWTKREQREIEEYEGNTERLKRYLRVFHRGGLSI